MTRFETTSLKNGKKGMYRLLLAALFVSAQLLINFHHVSDAHAASEDALVVECDICTVSPGIFDAPEKPATLEARVVGETRVSPVVDVRSTGIPVRSGGARAPPHTH